MQIAHPGQCSQGKCHACLAPTAALRRRHTCRPESSARTLLDEGEESIAESSQPDPPGGCCTAQLPKVWSRQHCGAVYSVFVKGLTANIIGTLDDPCPQIFCSLQWHLNKFSSCYVPHQWTA